MSYVTLNCFSARSGGFIDDDFVDVSDTNLTPEANSWSLGGVAGKVPTKVAETLTARPFVHLAHYPNVPYDPEPFYRWILNSALMPVLVKTFQLPAGTNGFAIAVYKKLDSDRGYLGYLAAFDPWWWIKSWRGHGPDPAPYAGDLAAALTLVEAANRVSPSLRAGVLEIALRQMSNITAEINKQIKTLSENSEK
jgi:hypothetical protein